MKPRPVSELTARVAFKTWLIARQRGYDAPEYQEAADAFDELLERAERLWRASGKLLETAEGMLGR